MIQEVIIIICKFLKIISKPFQRWYEFENVKIYMIDFIIMNYDVNDD